MQRFHDSVSNPKRRSRTRAACSETWQRLITRCITARPRSESAGSGGILPLAHRNLTGPLEEIGARHQQRAAEVIGLPFHPVVLRGVADGVAVAGPARRG